MTTKTKQKAAPKLSSIVEMADFPSMSNKEITDLVRDDETKSYEIYVAAESPLTSMTVCGVTFSYATKPVDFRTGDHTVKYGGIYELSARLVEVIKYRLEHQVATLRFDRDPKKREVFADRWSLHGVEYFAGRESALERIKKDPFIREMPFKEPVGERVIMRKYVEIKETEAVTTSHSMMLIQQSAADRDTIRELRARISGLEDTTV